MYPKRMLSKVLPGVTWYKNLDLPILKLETVLEAMLRTRMRNSRFFPSLSS